MGSNLNWFLCPSFLILCPLFHKREGSIKILKFILQVKAHLPSDVSSLKEACFELETSGEIL